MGPLACGGAVLACSFGAAPSTLVVLPKPVTALLPAASVMDHLPIVNIPPFGVCMSLANPEVAAATAAALGVLTPMPCIPCTVGPWVPGSLNVLVGEFPALDQTSECICAFGGVIRIVSPGQETVVL
jgi:hypothetical protein